MQFPLGKTRKKYKYIYQEIARQGKNKLPEKKEKG